MRAMARIGKSTIIIGRPTLASIMAFSRHRWVRSDVEHVDQSDYFFQRPPVIGNARFHGRRGPQRLMDANEIIMPA